MMPSFLEQVQKSEKNVEMEYPKGDTMFVGCNDGYVQEFSFIENKIVHDYGKILKGHITSISKTSDNKSQLVCDNTCGFKELDISARKQVNSLPVKSAVVCVVTHDNKFLITAGGKNKSVLTKWSVRSKKLFNTWQSGVNYYVQSQNCSQDNKYQLIGYGFGYLGIFDLQKHQTLKNIKFNSDSICSVAFSRDNQSAFFISNICSYIRMIKWQAGTNSGDDFDFNEEPKMVGNYCESICLTKDEKYLPVGSQRAVIVFETTTRKVTKEFGLTDVVQGISLINSLPQGLTKNEKKLFYSPVKSAIVCS